jgi:uncharacterized membrane protein YraQ (UPF0718 family)
MQRKNAVRLVLFAFFASLVAASFVVGFPPGMRMGWDFADFTVDMMRVLPCAFILIGLFEVWVRRETVERHLGRWSDWKAYVWAVLLAGTAVGGIIVALPVAHALYKKGAKLEVVLTYVSASAICRVPMAIFEASFLGLRFTLIRLCVSIPLVVGSSILLGRAFKRRGYQLT